jgi:hypothetical protein
MDTPSAEISEGGNRKRLNSVPRILQYGTNHTFAC